MGHILWVVHRSEFRHAQTHVLLKFPAEEAAGQAETFHKQDEAQEP